MIHFFRHDWKHPHCNKPILSVSREIFPIGADREYRYPSRIGYEDRCAVCCAKPQEQTSGTLLNQNHSTVLRLRPERVKAHCAQEGMRKLELVRKISAKLKKKSLFFAFFPCWVKA
jgi:hypothetical protein